MQKTDCDVGVSSSFVVNFVFALLLANNDITVHGAQIPLEYLTFEECSQSHGTAECFWVDSRNLEIFKEENALSSWTSWASQGVKSSLHEPFEISDAINEAYEQWPWPPNATDGAKSSDFIPFPSFVLGDPSNADRRQRTHNLLHSLGIENITFVPYTRAQDVDLENLMASNIIDQAAINRMVNSGWIGHRALKAYIANAMDHLNAVKMGADAGYDLFGIFEDDLMLAGSRGTVGYRINAALQWFPPTADMLYLEACHEKCSQRRFSYHYPFWARTTGPSCSAAIVFTKKGAQRVSRLTRPIFWGIDNMYAALIRAGLVEGYVITPTAFFQDGYWSSALQPLRGDSPGRKRGNRARPGVTQSFFDYVQ